KKDLTEKQRGAIIYGHQRGDSLRTIAAAHSPGRMYWGCFSWFGVGPLVPLKSSANGVSHLEILQKYALPTIKKFPANNNRDYPILVQDNARPHNVKEVQKFLNSNKVHVMKWLPQSPDLNPIENLWAEVKQSIRCKERPGNLIELDALVKKAWHEIPPELCCALVTSMPNQ
ncbi:2203_t:CDS:2, partial [Scutellospora calospora]